MFFGIEHSSLLFTGSFAHSDVPLYQGLLVPQAWTLGVEITFYLVAPFVLRSPRRLLALLAASLALRAVLIATGIGERSLDLPLLSRRVGAVPGRRAVAPDTAAALAGADAPLAPAAGTGRRHPGGVLLRALFIGLNHNLRDALAVLLFAALLPLAFLFQARYRLDKAIGELSYPIYICHALVILFFGWLLDGASAPAGAFRCAGADRLHRLRGPAQRADRRSVERLRVRLRAGGREDLSVDPRPAASQPAASRQRRVNPIRRAP